MPVARRNSRKKITLVKSRAVDSGGRRGAEERRGTRTLRVLSYNIHQGLTVARRKLTLAFLRDAIRSLGADLVILQEVAGSDGVGARYRGKQQPMEEASFQLEDLADSLWPYTAFGKNSVFSGGYHGNAILSRYPILESKNHDISIAKRGLVRRGTLYAKIEPPGLGSPLHVWATHLGLIQAERNRQVKNVCSIIEGKVPGAQPVVLAGDFNDWREVISTKVHKKLQLDEVFLAQDGQHARTFPSPFPVLRLDRIYFRHLKLNAALRISGRPWQFLSDHLPILAEFCW